MQEQEKWIDALTAQLEEEATFIQKVNDKVNQPTCAANSPERSLVRARIQPSVFDNQPSRFTAWRLFAALTTPLGCGEWL
jgi:hypothetical protein